LLYSPFKGFKEEDNVEEETVQPSKLEASITSANQEDVENTDKTIQDDKPRVSEVSNSYDPDTVSVVDDLPDEKHSWLLYFLPFLRDELSTVSFLLMSLNFTTRGAIAVYESQASKLFIDDYNTSETQLGAIVSISGIAGTIQLLYFKSYWTVRYSDMFLLLFGMFLMIVCTSIVITWGKVCLTI
jgi:hypothetical protein